MREIFKVPDVSCGHCKHAIESALQPVAGVTGASVSIDDKNVTVDYDDTGVERARIIQAIESAGYPVFA